MRIESKALLGLVATVGLLGSMSTATWANGVLYSPTTTTSTPASTPEPYSGPIIGTIDFRSPDGSPDSKPRPGGDLVMRGPNAGLIESAEIDGRKAPVTPQDEETVIIKIPEETEPGVKDIIVEGPFGKLTIQDGVRIAEPNPVEVANDAEVPGFTTTKPADCRPTDTAFSAWTQDQGDGTVLFFAKNVVGAGLVEFEQNGRVLKSLIATSEDNPNIRWGNCSPYFLHSFERENLKNGLEVYLDDVRWWRAAYSGLGLKVDMDYSNKS